MGPSRCALLLALAFAGRAMAQDEPEEAPPPEVPPLQDDDASPEPEVVREEVPDVSGDLALSYGRNFGQGLNVAGFAGELKANVDPQLALGVRLGGGVGAGFGAGSIQGYVGAPLLLKGEAFFTRQRQRPFVGLGAGLTWVAAAGAYAAPTELEAVAYSMSGFLPTIMPELGVDLGMVRLSLSHSVLLGAGRGAATALGPAGVEVGDEAVPSLSGTVLQIGVHFGGVRERAEVPTGVIASTGQGRHRS